MHRQLPEREMESLDDFGMILLQQASKESKRKISRRKPQPDLKLGEYYPAEGHFAVMCPVLAVEEPEKKKRIFSSGGARRGGDSSWGDAGRIIEYVVEMDKNDDVTLASVVSCKTTGVYAT